MASCYDKPFIENGVYVPGGEMYTPDEMFINAKKNFSIIIFSELSYKFINTIKAFY